MNDLVSKFTTHLKSALTRALCLVIEHEGPAIEPSHLLWALSTQEGSVAAEILKTTGMDVARLSRFAGASHGISGDVTPHQTVPPLSPAAKQIIEKAVMTANTYEHRYVGTEHLLAGILSEKPKEVMAFLTDVHVEIDELEAALVAIFKTATTFPDFTDRPLLPAHDIGLLDDPHGEDPEDGTPALDYFTEELTTKEVTDDIDPLIGRDKEVERLMHILARRTKNNPILLGEPGVGKTAIVEGLAKRIVDGEVPAALEDKRIHRLDLASLIAGTMYRGEFESRLRQLIEDVSAREDVILFIDEVHTIMGAGSSSGSLDAANMLKPALARGEIRCIGATTPTEYKRFIETDSALERRFQPVMVKEPTLEETRNIVNGIRHNFESFHRVTFTQGAIDTALTLANRYFATKQFPDKAIDVLDEVGASAWVHRKREKRVPSLGTLKRERETLEKERREAVKKSSIEEALAAKTRLEHVNKTISAIEEALQTADPILVDEDQVFRVVAQMTGIPVTQLSSKEEQRLRKLAPTLAKHILGQDRVLDQVVHAVKRAKLGLQHAERPLASFLFIGPSGVGKTELAHQLAKELFDGEEAFLRLDMSEFSAPFTTSKLIGSPAGYVGYRESAALTDFVKTHPHSVILFDEIEKAHQDVHHLLLQILDHGMLQDATGRRVNFRNAIIILTSNAGSERFEATSLGFSENATTALAERNKDLDRSMKDVFSRELLNRIQHTCIFEPFTKATAKRIAQKEFRGLKERFAAQNIQVEASPAVITAITERITRKHGARDIQRVLEQQVERPLIETILASPKKRFSIKTTKDGSIKITPQK